MTLSEFAQGFVRYCLNHPGERQGQAFVNYVWELSPFLAGGFHVSTFDPYYDDEVNAEAWAYVNRNLHMLEG